MDSVVKTVGRPLSQQLTEIRRIAEAVVPPGGETMPAPLLNNHERIDWLDFHRFVDDLDQTLFEPHTSLVIRLLRANVRLI